MSEIEARDPRATIAERLADYLTDDQVSRLIDEVLALGKTAPFHHTCSNCGHLDKGTITIPDAKATVGALTDLLAQGFGRPGEARIDEGTIIFRRFTNLADLEADTHAQGATNTYGSHTATPP